MAAIELSRGIERILPHFDPQKPVGLPEKSNIAPEGERITNYLEAHFNRLPIADELLDFIRPKLDHRVTAPWYYTKIFQATWQRWKKFKGLSAEEQETLDQGVALLDTVAADMELLSDYILCLQRV